MLKTQKHSQKTGLDRGFAVLEKSLNKSRKLEKEIEALKNLTKKKKELITTMPTSPTHAITNFPQRNAGKEIIDNNFKKKLKL